VAELVRELEHLGARQTRIILKIEPARS